MADLWSEEMSARLSIRVCTIRVRSLLWKARLLQPRTECTLRAAPNIPHPCLQAIVYQQASIIVKCILVVADGHVEHGVS